MAGGTPASGRSPVARGTLTRRPPTQQRLQLGAAEEPLAATHRGAGATAQALEVDGRDRRGQGPRHLAPGDALTEADDAPEVGVARRSAAAAGRGVDRARRCSACGPRAGPCPRLERQPRAGELLAHVLGDRHRRRQAGGADPADARVTLRGVDRDLVVGCSVAARRPAYTAVTSWCSSAGISRRPSGVQVGEPGARSRRCRARSRTSSAVGPRSRLPYTVGVSSTPLRRLRRDRQQDLLQQRSRRACRTRSARRAAA